jgi:hypothetical protein
LYLFPPHFSQICYVYWPCLLFQRISFLFYWFLYDIFYFYFIDLGHYFYYFALSAHFGFFLSFF